MTDGIKPIPYRTAQRQVAAGLADEAWLTAEIEAGRVSAPTNRGVDRLARVPEAAKETVGEALTYVQSLNAHAILQENGVKVNLSIQVEGAPSRPPKDD